jgi:trk system potassium uptake protein TrkH
MPRPGPSGDLSQSLLERARPYLVTALLPIIILAAGSLVLEYGFDVRPEGLDVLHWIEWVALAGMLADPLVRLALARHRLALLRFRWFEFALAGAFLGYVGLVYLAPLPEREVWLLRGVHLAIILGIVSRLVELHQHLAMKRVRPAMLIVGSFLTLIAIGTGLLLLPASTADGQPPTTLTDAIFTATSAVCVTGLIVVDTGTHWSRFGHYVILVLIQLGGLGLMTYASVFALFMWRGMRIREVLVLREAFTHDLRAEIGRLTTFILLTTLAVEAAGALLLFGLWDHTATEAVVPLGERIFYSVFHSISAFCNAGLCLYSDSLMSYRDTWQVNLVFPLLIISGGIGFAVLYNLARLVRHRVLSRKHAPLVKRRLTLQAKLAITATVVLLVGGLGLMLVFEAAPGREDAWRRTAVAPDASAPPETAPASPLGRTWAQRVSGAWFLATTARTAGFNTSDTTRLAGPTKFLTVVLMFIGASPGSTGGGIKTVTVVVVLCGVWAALRGRSAVQAFRRQIPPETVRRALAILAVGVAWVAATSMALAAWGIRDGAQFTFLDALFETQSAFATVGLSTGTTPLLNTFGRLLLAGTMFVGRIGLLTLFVAMQFRTQPQRYDYAKEYVAIS